MEAAVLQAVYERLADPELLTYAPGGVWLISIPFYDEIHKWEIVDGDYERQDETLHTPTWIEFNVQAGGSLDFAPGEDWKDLQIRAIAKSMDSPDQAALADERLDALLHEWVPPIEGWPNRWRALRVEDLDRGYFEESPVNRWVWIAGGNFRFRFGRPRA